MPNGTASGLVYWIAVDERKWTDKTIYVTSRSDILISWWVLLYLFRRQDKANRAVTMK